MKRTFSLLLLCTMLLGSLSLFACQGPGGGGGGGGGVDVEFLDHLDEYGDSMDFSAQEEFVISFFDLYKYEVFLVAHDKIDFAVAAHISSGEQFIVLFAQVLCGHGFAPSTG